MDRNRTLRRGIRWGLLLLLASVPAASAQDHQEQDQANMDAGDPNSRPWAAGVSADDQREAMVLFQQGNELLTDSLFIKAAETYREALRHWDHPAIHYNLALALLNLDQPLQVYEALEKAMSYGPAPLDLDKFERARSYKQLVEAQIATVEVICEEPGAKVTMDGREIFTGPGRYRSLVRVGEHSFIATKPGYLPTNETRTLLAGETEVVELVLLTERDLIRRVRRWDAWKPWTVFGAGVAVALAGGGLHYASYTNFREFDDFLDANCRAGCPDLDVSQRDRAQLQQTLAIGSYVVGGLALTTGSILLYLNREKVFRVDVIEAEESVSILPFVAPDSAGVLARIRF